MNYWSILLAKSYEYVLKNNAFSGYTNIGASKLRTNAHPILYNIKKDDILFLSNRLDSIICIVKVVEDASASDKDNIQHIKQGFITVQFKPIKLFSFPINTSIFKHCIQGTPFSSKMLCKSISISNESLFNDTLDLIMLYIDTNSLPLPKLSNIKNTVRHEINYVSKQIISKPYDWKLDKDTLSNKFLNISLDNNTLAITNTDHQMICLSPKESKLITKSIHQWKSITQSSKSLKFLKDTLYIPDHHPFISFLSIILHSFKCFLFWSILIVATLFIIFNIFL